MQLLELYNRLKFAVVVAILVYVVCFGIWGYAMFSQRSIYEMREQHLVRVIRNLRREHHEETQAYQWLHQEKVHLEVRNEDLGSENDNLRMEVEDANEINRRQRRKLDKERQTSQRLHQEKVNLEVQKADLGSENDNLRMEVENVTEINRRQRRKLDKERQTSQRLHQEKVNLEVQKADLGSENDNLRMEVENVTDTLQMMKWFLNEQTKRHTQELEQIRTEHAKQLELVYRDHNMSIEELEEHIRLVELELRHKRGKIVDLQINLRQALNELEQCKSSTETWSWAAKFAGEAAGLAGTAVLYYMYGFPYASDAFKGAV